MQFVKYSARMVTFFVQLQPYNQLNVKNTTEQLLAVMPCMLKITATIQLLNVSCSLLKNVKIDTVIRPIVMSIFSSLNQNKEKSILILVATVHEDLSDVMVLMVVPVLVVFLVLKVQLVVRVTAVPVVKEVNQVTLQVQSLFHTKHLEKKVFQVHPDNLVPTVHKVVQAHKVQPVHVVNLVSVEVKVQMVDVVQPGHLDPLVVPDLLVHKAHKVPPVLLDVVSKMNLTTENTKQCSELNSKHL